MTDEEMAEESFKRYRITDEDYEILEGNEEVLVFNHEYVAEEQYHRLYKNGFLAGLKAGRPQWHKVADGDLPKGDDGFGKNGIHRKIYLKDRYGHLYTGNYFPKDDTHKEDCFAVEFLEWGFQGSRFCAKEQISEWCEIPFDKE